MLKDMDLSRENLRKFGRVMFFCLTAFGLILFLKQKPLFKILWLLGILFLTAAQICPLSLKHIYRIWMKLAFCLGWLNSRLILFAIYYFVITPIGLLARIFRKDFLGLKIESDRDSYWIKIEDSHNKDTYERLF